MSDWIAAPKGKKEISSIAVRTRYILGFGDDYVPNIIGILENELQKIFPDYYMAVENLGNDERGNQISAHTEFDPHRIVLTDRTYSDLFKQDPVARFTGAHEIGHLMMHEGATVNRAMNSEVKYQNNPKLSAEWQANFFAANFLMPEHIVRNFASPQELAEFTLVSLRAAQLRMMELGLWSNQKN